MQNDSRESSLEAAGVPGWRRQRLHRAVTGDGKGLSFLSPDSPGALCRLDTDQGSWPSPISRN